MRFTTMARELKHVDVTNLPELLQLAREVQRTREPSVLHGDREDLALVIPLRQGRLARPLREQLIDAEIWTDAGATNPGDPWANYDPERVKRALGQSAGALTGVDRDALVQDIEEAREQETPGRPF